MPAMKPAAVFQAVALCLFSWIGTSIAASSQQRKTFNIPSFDWSAVEPSSNLKWHKCYSPSTTQDSTQHIFTTSSVSNPRTFSCARLSLPLDYHNTTKSYNVSVPVLKVSSPPSPSHRGTIIMGLGGAGSSRIKDLVNYSSRSDFLELIDPDFEYDFLTFDNRGFGYSSPTARCFESVLDSTLWEERMADLGGFMSTLTGDEELEVRIAAAKGKAELCINRSEMDTDIMRHMTTAYAARDMLEILKRLPDHSSQSFGAASGQFKEVEKLKLKFIGLSYGTIVGQTFASLYPEYVSRMILDGPVHAKDWVAKWQMDHLIDTDAIWESLYDDCFEAKEACPLWQALDTKPADIKHRIDDFLKKLKRRPVYTVSVGNARLITYRDVKLAMYWTTMVPDFAAPIMATVLDSLIKGYTNVTLGFPFDSVPTASNSLHEETQDSRADSNADAGTALNCGDAEDITNSSVVDFKEYLSALEEQSSVAAFFQGERKIRCLGWPIRPEWRFTGPFTTKRDNGSSKLSTPILFMGNKLDPMTSLHGLRDVTKDFPGSVILEQNARGHCALGNAVSSDCTLRYVRNYLKDGTLPEPRTVCGKDCNLFDKSCLAEGDSRVSRMLV